jgi:uncharacterized protein (TIGR01619 family)
MARSRYHLPLRHPTNFAMTGNWKFYICNVNDKLASIFVDLGLRDEAPLLSKKWLLWVWVYMQNPRPDELSDSSEAPILSKIEDVLNANLASHCDGIRCGRITTQGRREFYFYAETRERFSDAVKTALADFAEYKFDMGEQEDPLWEQYLDVLYPSEEQLEQIKNGDVLGLLAEQGDVLSVPREVQHWLYFRSGQSRLSFSESAVSAGFKIVSEITLEGDLPFEISVARTQSLERRSIDDTVIELLRLAQQFDGEYDGWETPVINQ